MSHDYVEITSGGRCYSLDLKAKELYREREERVKLTRKQWDLLKFFADQPPRQLLTKDALEAQVWNGVHVGDETIAQTVAALRKALKDTRADPHFIETVHGDGYRFIADVRRLRADQQPAVALDEVDRDAWSEPANLRGEVPIPADGMSTALPDLLRTNAGLDAATKQVRDTDDLGPVERCISTASDPQVAKHALILIARLARRWDGRTIKRSASFPVIRDFYQATTRVALKAEAGKTLASLGLTASKRFVIGEIPGMAPEVLAAVLGLWADEIAFWDDVAVWRDEIVSHLVGWVTKPADDCVWIDPDGHETDCRTGVFRTLGELRAEQAASAVETYLAAASDPVETIVEAAGAHWRITGFEQFAPLLHCAIDSTASIDGKEWLEEIRLSKQPRIIVTEHKTEHGLEQVSGTFAREPDWNFQLYLSPEPSVDTYKHTRIAEMYIAAADTTQWSWHSLNREEPGWRYGRVLFSDLLDGLRSLTITPPIVSF